MNKKERVLEVARLKTNSNIYEFERECGLSNGSVRNMGNSTRDYMLDKILARYKDVNPRFLKHGEEPVLINSDLNNNSEKRIKDLEQENMFLKELLKSKEEIITLLKK